MTLFSLYLRPLAAVEGVAKEHGNGHGTDAAGNGGDLAGILLGGLVVDVAHQPVSTLGAGIVDAVDADVDDDGTLLDPVALDHLGPSDGGHDDVGVLDDAGNVVRLAVDDGNGGIAMHEEHGHGQTDEVGPADYYGVLALELDAAAVQQFDATLGSAGNVEGNGSEVGPLDLGAADVGAGAAQRGGVERMETIDVLLGVDAVEDFILINVLGKRQLNQNAMNSRIGVQFGNLSRESLHGHVRRIVKSKGRDATFLARLLLHSDVRLRIATLAHQNDSQAGNLAAVGLQLLDGILDLRADRLRNGLSIDVSSGHLENAIII